MDLKLIRGRMQTDQVDRTQEYHGIFMTTSGLTNLRITYKCTGDIGCSGKIGGRFMNS